jgi:hypothetical protein
MLFRTGSTQFLFIGSLPHDRGDFAGDDLYTQGRVFREVCVMLQHIFDGLHGSFHALLVKRGVIGAGDLDGEPLVVVAHGRYYNRSGGSCHGFFQNLFIPL